VLEEGSGLPQDMAGQDDALTPEARQPNFRFLISHYFVLGL
jgi:hypothetical protein